MLVRNLLKAGYFAEPIPLGIPATLEYRETGTLKRVWIGYDVSEYGTMPEWVSYSDELYSLLLQKSKVPSHIQTKDGSIYIQGVIYTSKHPVKSTGIFPKDMVDEILEYIQNGVDFGFFAGNVLSTGINFSGAAQIRSWLQLQKFNILPGYIVPQGDVELSVKNILAESPFKYELIMGYFIIRGNQCKVEYLNNKQYKVKDIKTNLDQNGYVRSTISFLDLSSGTPMIFEITVSYYTVIQYQLKLNDVVILNFENKIISKYPIQNKLVNQGTLTCPVCGKQYVIKDEFTTCPDVHCLSTSYSSIIHFLDKLNLEKFSHDEYENYVASGKLTTFSDVLLLPQYNDIEILVSLYDLLDAIIPVQSVRDRSDIWNFYSLCNGSWDTIQYYIEHPNYILADLHLNVPNLINWLYDKENVKLIEDIYQFSNISIQENVKKFEGSPIFRGKKIYLTGQFLHGTILEIESILRSYSAEISDADEADCAIIGDIPNGINGGKINSMKNKNLPIFSETEFFNLYDIDSDLK